jgi:hypothetical protein
LKEKLHYQNMAIKAQNRTHVQDYRKKEGSNQHDRANSPGMSKSSNDIPNSERASIQRRNDHNGKIQKA